MSATRVIFVLVAMLGIGCDDTTPGPDGDVDSGDGDGDGDVDADSDGDGDADGDADADADADQPRPVDDAVIVEADLPTSLACGQSFEASVTVRNTGTATWTRAAEYKLGAVGDDDPLHDGDPRVWLPEEASVGPGESWTFAVVLTAPSTPGTYTTDWQMVHEAVGWFGEIARSDVNVACEGPVDATTLSGKNMFGYQGWFACPGDGSTVDRWVHWFRSQTPTAENATVDFWPDVTELGPEERCDTSMTMPGGGSAQVYSAWNEATVVRHFAWMEDHGLDGVMLQRFISELGDPRFLELRDQVTRNVRAGAEAHGRVFNIMYDISGHPGDGLVEAIESDWTHLVDDLGVTGSDRYLHHEGRPLVAIWGLGFADRPGTPAQAAALIEWFHGGAPARLQATVMGGVPTHWRTLSGDSSTDPDWAAVYRSWDVISPWTVGRYADDAGADAFRRDLIEPDMAEAATVGADYLPVIFPGFSWYNLNDGPLNQIPRNGGRFYWRQVYNAVDAGAAMTYTAMFDEVDEGTAMFMLAPTASALPVEGSFVPLDIDGEALPPDWYLSLAGEATRVLRGETPLTEARPIDP